MRSTSALLCYCSVVDHTCTHPSLEWRCDDKTQCVQRTSFCDGRVDCNDRSDEAVCQRKTRQKFIKAVKKV